MRITPKYQSGGTAGFFTVAEAVSPKSFTPPSSSKKKKSDDDSDSSKGLLTEKDFFNMLKDVDGLPNEMDLITNHLLKVFKHASVFGSDTADLLTMYISTLNSIRRALYNKKKFDDAYKLAVTDNSLKEIVIDANGLVLCSNKETGEILRRTASEVISLLSSGNSSLIPITVENLAYIRAYEPSMAFTSSDDIFNLMTSNMSITKLNSLLSEAKNKLGSSTTEDNYYLTSLAQEGLLQFDLLSPANRSNIIESMGTDGYIEVNNELKTNANAITAYYNYLCLALPEDAVSYIMLKTGKVDREDALRTLVLSYLNGSLENIVKSKSTIHGGSSSSSSSKSSQTGGPGSDEQDLIDNSKHGYWGQVLAELGGSTGPYTLIKGNSRVDVSGVRYQRIGESIQRGTLEDYLINENIGYMVDGTVKILFGDLKVYNQSYADIAINPNAGAMVVTLPYDPTTNLINFKLLDEYEKITNKILSLGIDYGSEEYNKKLGEELSKNDDFTNMVDPITLKPLQAYFKQYFVLTGWATSKTVVENKGSGNRQISLYDAKSEWVNEITNNNTIDNILKNYFGGNYEFDHKDWFEKYTPSFYNHMYSGNIYIPLTPNILNTKNADNVPVTKKEANAMEDRSQNINKYEEKAKTSNPASISSSNRQKS